MLCFWFATVSNSYLKVNRERHKIIIRQWLINPTNAFNGDYFFRFTPNTFCCRRTKWKMFIADEESYLFVCFAAAEHCEEKFTLWQSHFRRNYSLNRKTRKLLALYCFVIINGRKSSALSLHSAVSLMDFKSW